MPSKEPIGEMNVRYCSACSTSFDVDEEGVEGQFGIIPVAFCAACRVGVREMSEIIWDLVPREDKKPYEKPEIRELSVKEIQELCTSGWRSCIDHIIRPDSPCPVCEIERLTEFLERGGIDSSAVLASEDTGEWRDENERLTDDLAIWEGTAGQLDKKLQRLQADHKAAELLWWDEKGALEDQISELQARVEKLEAIENAAKEWWNAPNRLSEDASLGKLAALIEAATEQGESDE